METQLALKDFDYDLPPALVAQYPLAERDQSRMLVLNRLQGVAHQQFRNLQDFLNPGDLVVLNNVKVMPARLIGHRVGHTGKVEVFLLHPLNFERTQWQVLMRPAKRLKPGTHIVVSGPEGVVLNVEILTQGEGGQGTVEISWSSGSSLDSVLEAVGQIPLPPYLMRSPEDLDKARYQTVFAKTPGAQAAPTAGLHFTPEILAGLEAKGVGLAEVTLHVSAGTFRPVLVDSIDEHRMDPEYYELPPETAEAIQKTKQAGSKVVCVGTTSLKTVETVALKHQGQVVQDKGWSELFIRPGFQFQVADALLTNFHLPKSTLLMLVSAFASQESIMAAYQEAIQAQYRFYSYGDCMLII